MYPTIDKIKTGEQIKNLMKQRNITVKDVQKYMGFACVQSVYHWLDGSSLPSIDNLYALSTLLNVPIDEMICGNRLISTNKVICFDRDSFDEARRKRLCLYWEKYQSLCA